MEQYLYDAFFPVSINVLVITMTFVERKIIMKMLPPLLFSMVDHYFECFQNFLCSRKCSKIIIFIADSGMPNAKLLDNIVNCFVHPTHPLNQSDHLPILIILNLSALHPTPLTSLPPPSRVNWSHAIESGSISLYHDAVRLVVNPLLKIDGQFIDELDTEICFVCNTLADTAKNLLPLHKPKNRPRKIISTELKSLCRESKKAWRH